MNDFLASFALFWAPWSTALLLAIVLPWLGVVLLLRQQVFLCAAIGQASALGYAVPLACGLGALVVPGGLLAAVACAVLALRSLSEHGSRGEARAAVVFLLGGSGSMCLLADSPLGMHEVQRMFLSSLLGAGTADVAIGVALLVASGLAVAFVARPLALWAIDPVTARAQGLPMVRTDVVVGAWIGGVLAFAIHTGGLLLAFGGALLPVLCARATCRSLRTVWLVAPLLGGGMALLGLFLAHWWDRPPGQMIVAVQAIAVLVLARVSARSS